MRSVKLYHTVHFEDKEQEALFVRVWLQIEIQLTHKEILMRYPVYIN